MNQSLEIGTKLNQKLACNPKYGNSTPLSMFYETHKNVYHYQPIIISVGKLVGASYGLHYDTTILVEETLYNSAPSAPLSLRTVFVPFGSPPQRIVERQRCTIDYSKQINQFIQWFHYQNQCFTSSFVHENYLGRTHVWNTPNCTSGTRQKE